MAIYLSLVASLTKGLQMTHRQPDSALGNRQSLLRNQIECPQSTVLLGSPLLQKNLYLRQTRLVTVQAFRPEFSE